MVTFKKFLLIKESTRELMPEIYAALEGYDDPMVGVHFSKGIHIKNKGNPIPHIGLNLKTDHHDPIGIYAFPKDYVLSGKLASNQTFSKYKYFYIVKPSSKARILNLSKLTEDAADKLLDDMGLDPDYMDDESVYHNSGKTSVGHMFWAVLEDVRKDMETKNKNISWNILFKDTGYNVLYDEGDGIIHPNEPTQIVYLNTGAMDVLYFGKQQDNVSKVFSLYVNSFPDFIPQTSSKKDKLWLKSPDGISILIQPQTNIFTVKTYGYTNNFFKDYNYEDLNENAINELKDHMIQNRYYLTPVEAKKEGIDPVLEKISKRFRIKLKPDKNGEMEIRQRYQDGNKDYVVTFYIRTFKNKIFFVLQKSGKGVYTFEYNINYVFEYNDEETPEDIVNTGLNGLMEKSKEQYSPTAQYESKRTIEFLKKRVFAL